MKVFSVLFSVVVALLIVWEVTEAAYHANYSESIDNNLVHIENELDKIVLQ